jgi:hypothetical protein
MLKQIVKENVKAILSEIKKQCQYRLQY